MQFFDTTTLSLANPGGVQSVETKIPLWWADGANNIQAGTTTQYLRDGGTETGAISTGNHLITLSSSWNEATMFAFESTLWNGGSNGTGSATLYDITAGVPVAASQVQTTGTTATVLRSGQFTLTPGHVYGVSFVTTSSTYVVYICDASLIVFPS